MQMMATMLSYAMVVLDQSDGCTCHLEYELKSNLTNWISFHMCSFLIYEWRFWGDDFSLNGNGMGSYGRVWLDTTPKLYNLSISSTKWIMFFVKRLDLSCCGFDL